MGNSLLSPSKGYGSSSRTDPMPLTSHHATLHDGPGLQQELFFSPRKHQPPAATTCSTQQSGVAAAAACCLRCGITAGAGSVECRFHPALLKDAGPLLYCPEWHACRAAAHSSNEPGCYTRQGHYHPGHAVTDTGLVKTGIQQHAAAAAGDKMPQPRAYCPLPLPVAKQ